MKTNILNLVQILEKGYDIQMKNGTIYLRKQNKLITYVPISKNHVFILNINHIVARCMNACLKDNTWLLDL